MVGFGMTDVGLVRQNNEDSIFVSDCAVGILPNMYIVSDGMGGHNAGEVASSMGIKYFCEYINNVKDANRQSEDRLDILVEAVRFANQKLYEISLHNSHLNGMGATFSVCTFDENKLFVAHVGDSRVYLVSGKDIQQITTDHTFVHEMVKAGQITEDEARVHPQRNIITRAIGTSMELNVDGIIRDISDAQYVLICSDGLSNKLDNEKILSMIQSELSLKQKCESLINEAKQNGGDDNISAVLVEIKEVKA